MKASVKLVLEMMYCGGRRKVVVGRMQEEQGILRFGGDFDE